MAQTYFPTIDFNRVAFMVAGYYVSLRNAGGTQPVPVASSSLLEMLAGALAHSVDVATTGGYFNSASDVASWVSGYSSFLSADGSWKYFILRFCAGLHAARVNSGFNADSDVSSYLGTIFESFRVHLQLWPSSSGGGGGGSSSWDTTKIDELIAQIGTLNITGETPYAIGTGDF